MQFNFVATTDTGAIRLCFQLSVETVAILSETVKHPTQGYVDALVMNQQL
jgi:hypothetical protein